MVGRFCQRGRMSELRWPIRRVTFALERERRDSIGGEVVAVYRFLSEDWPSSIAVLRMRERWPELRFDMKAGYLEMGGSCK